MNGKDWSKDKNDWERMKKGGKFRRRIENRDGEGGGRLKSRPEGREDGKIKEARIKRKMEGQKKGKERV